MQLKKNDSVLVHPNVFTALGKSEPYNSDGNPSSLECQIMNLENFDETLDILNSLGIKGGQSASSSASWVEGVNGNGIGEKINFETNGEVLYFFNGYVSFSKPWLYTDNGRVKKIKISSKKVC